MRISKVIKRHFSRFSVERKKLTAKSIINKINKRSTKIENFMKEESIQKNKELLIKNLKTNFLLNPFGYDYFNRMILIKKLSPKLHFLIRINSAKMIEHEIDLYSFHKEKYKEQGLGQEAESMKQSFQIEAEFQAEVINLREFYNTISPHLDNKMLHLVKNQISKNTNIKESVAEEDSLAQVCFQSLDGDVFTHSVGFTAFHNSLLCPALNSHGKVYLC
jgi:hypothetical protein